VSRFDQEKYLYKETLTLEPPTWFISYCRRAFLNRLTGIEEEIPRKITSITGRDLLRLFGTREQSTFRKLSIGADRKCHLRRKSKLRKNENSGYYHGPSWCHVCHNSPITAARSVSHILICSVLHLLIALHRSFDRSTSMSCIF